jgi:hypothetical protein
MFNYNFKKLLQYNNRKFCKHKIMSLHSWKYWYFKIVIIGINCSFACPIDCGPNGYCIDRGAYLPTTFYYGKEFTRLNTIVSSGGIAWVDTPDGNTNWVQCECFNGWSGRRCHIYTADWIRIIKTTFNWALFPLIFILICCFQPVISKIIDNISFFDNKEQTLDKL